MKLFVAAVVLGSVLWGCVGPEDRNPSRSRPVTIDPVCGEVVDPATPFRGEYRANLYYFHSDECRGRFAAAPDYYAYGLIPPREPRVEGNVALYPDPVCGRDTPSTRWSMEYGGRRYYFHDNDCLLEFRFRPQAYLTPNLQLEAK